MTAHISGSSRSESRQPTTVLGDPDATRYPSVSCQQCDAPLNVLGLVAGETPATQYENVRCRNCGAGGTLVQRVDDWAIAKRVGPAVRHRRPGARRRTNADQIHGHPRTRPGRRHP